MPLHDEALNVEGGCNCGAVHYKVAIPALAQRLPRPLAPADAPVPLPFIALDHCNDCRRTTGSLLPALLCAPIDMCFVSLVAASSATLAPKASAYKSSHERWRWFCSRCGINIASTAVMPAGFPSMLDITLGSVRREYVDGEALVPERHLWWDYGVDWIQRLATEGYVTLPIHPDYRLTDTVTLRRPG
ncbi:hypothetical protein BU23DRAFT_582460 [Bimuria novae-zelandiae CBS 107.79]|uniref:CENP-V/GFA domain-containing protein n=1 Tax=Bimuria novae-zelandiae CBS 107.79 TaxID=1447943 RepID=A0A6A5V3V8_9PLEO|nr:hypothetical protein BU23DRAFT_582460 [Bimuria novae-zelandiae CBS 107.79]